MVTFSSGRREGRKIRNKSEDLPFNMPLGKPGRQNTVKIPESEDLPDL